MGRVSHERAPAKNAQVRLLSGRVIWSLDEAERELSEVELKDALALRTGVPAAFQDLLPAPLDGDDRLLLLRLPALDPITLSFAMDSERNPLAGTWLSPRAAFHISRDHICRRLVYCEIPAQSTQPRWRLHALLVPHSITEGRLWWTGELRNCEWGACACWRPAPADTALGRVLVAPATSPTLLELRLPDERPAASLNCEPWLDAADEPRERTPAADSGGTNARERKRELTPSHPRSTPPRGAAPVKK